MWAVVKGTFPGLTVSWVVCGPRTFCKMSATQPFPAEHGSEWPLIESILIVDDEHWKRIQNVLSPTFTSERLKEMGLIIKHYAENLVKNAETKAKLNESADMKE